MKAPDEAGFLDAVSVVTGPAPVRIRYACELLSSMEIYSKDHHQLPDGTESGICTNAALLIAKPFGGAVWGYTSYDNPKAGIGPGHDGHDFAIIHSRFYVDWWLHEYIDKANDLMLDVFVLEDMEKIQRRYGDPNVWFLVQSFHLSKTAV